jgi:hypothetical protein
MFFHVFFLFPETAGKSLEEVEAMFTDPKGIKWIGTPAWRTHVVKRTLDSEHGEVKEPIGHHYERSSDEEAGQNAVVSPAPVGSHAPDMQEVNKEAAA